MEIKQNIYQKRLELFHLVNELQNVSKACRKIGVSRQYFYELRKIYQKEGEEALKGKNRKKPNLKNRVATEIENAVVSFSYQYPSYGQVRVANELRQNGIVVSPGGVRSIWKRNGMKNYQERIYRLKELFLTPASI
jgi:transposase